MRTTGRFCMLLGLATLGSACLFAQAQTTKEWQRSMKFASTKHETLDSQIKTLQSQIDSLKKEDAAKAAAVENCSRDFAAADQQWNELQASLRREGAPKVYTVGTWAANRDCLWNIARKPSIYDDVWLWPKIWQANRDEIKDPDLIYPGEKLQIPQKSPLTRNETMAENGYYQQKEMPPARAQADIH
jgi:outer membrane murein-binding lipoprotein Lpp